MDIEWNWDQDDEFLGEKLPADTLDRKSTQNIFMKSVLHAVLNPIS